MRIFLAGATGALGRRLLPLLIADGHPVSATTRTPAKLNSLGAAGAEPVLLDGLDRDGIMREVNAARPEVVIHEMTALADLRNFRRFDKILAPTNTLRTDGTAHLIAAATAAGARRMLVQSFTGWPNARDGGRVKTEDDPLDPNPPPAMAPALDAIRRLEAMVMNAPGLTGLVLRYGAFYGPGTSLEPGGAIAEAVRRRYLPIVGNGGGIWSFVHIDDAARATQAAVTRGPAGVYNIVDDRPVEVATWLPALARELGAKPPRRVPEWMARLLVGDAGVTMMTTVRGSSNAKARQLLGWTPTYPDYRVGFAHALAGADALPAAS
jgi:2-alkyl-3-oxoalkanoate reductase